MTVYSDDLTPAQVSQSSALEGVKLGAIGNGKWAWRKAFLFFSRPKGAGGGLETLCRHHPAVVMTEIFTGNPAARASGNRQVWEKSNRRSR